MNVTRADEERFIAMAALAGVTFSYNSNSPDTKCRWMAHIPGIPADKQGLWMRKSRAALSALRHLEVMTAKEVNDWLERYDLKSLPDWDQFDAIA